MSDPWDTYSTRWSPLRGHRLASVSSEEDGTVLRFTTEDGARIEYTTEGDCCSVSWIEHLTVPSDIAGAVVTGVSEPALDPQSPVPPSGWDEASQRYYDVVSVYHTAFATDRGEIIVEYRNDSNGYYGGWLEGPRPVA